MSKIINIDFETYTLADINGQDNWALGPANVGGSIDAIAGVSAAWQSTNTGSTHYVRPFDTGILPGDELAQGVWYKLKFDYYLSSGLATCHTITSLTNSVGQAPFAIKVIRGFGGSDGIQLIDGGNVAHLLGVYSFDAWHTVEVTRDANGKVTVSVDSVPQPGSFFAYPASNVEQLALYSIDFGSVVANAFRWDNIVAYVREGDTEYKYFLGR